MIREISSIYHPGAQHNARDKQGSYSNAIKLTVLWEDAVATDNSNRRFG